MPIITIQQSPGRTVDQRRLLIQRITEAFEEAYALPPETVNIFFKTTKTICGVKQGDFI